MTKVLTVRTDPVLLEKAEAKASMLEALGKGLTHSSASSGIAVFHSVRLILCQLS